MSTAINVFFSIAFVLGLRSALLAFFEQKGVLRTLGDALISFLFFLWAAVLYLSTDFSHFGLAFISLLGIALIAGWDLYQRLHGLQKKSYLYRKSLFLLAYVIGCFIALFAQFSEDLPILKIVLSGKTDSETVEWKNPTSPLTGATVTSYEVKLETPKGKALGSVFVYGDLIGLRAKVVRFHPFLYFLGFRSLFRIDALYNGYTTLERMNSLPLRAYPFKASNTSDFTWKLWELHYFERPKSRLIESATYESNYFPLVDPQGKPFEGSFFLTLTDGGLSSLPTL